MCQKLLSVRVVLARRASRLDLCRSLQIIWRQNVTNCTLVSSRADVRRVKPIRVFERVFESLRKPLVLNRIHAPMCLDLLLSDHRTCVVGVGNPWLVPVCAVLFMQSTPLDILWAWFPCWFICATWQSICLLCYWLLKTQSLSLP